MLRNVQSTILELKVMLRETQGARYMEKLHEDMCTLIRMGVNVHKTAESVTLMKFDDGKMSVEQKSVVLCSAEKLVNWEKEYDDVLTWYKRFKPSPSNKRKVADAS